VRLGIDCPHHDGGRLGGRIVMHCSRGRAGTHRRPTRGTVDTVDIRDYLRVVRASWLLLLVGLLLGAGTALGVSLLRTPQYTATTQLYVTTNGGDDLNSAVQGSQYTEQKVASYARLLTSQDLATTVIDDLGLGVAPEQLTRRIQADVVPDTTLIDVSVTDPSPERALAITRTINTEFGDLVRQLETPVGETTPRVQVSVVATPLLPDERSSPSFALNTVLGAILGLALAVVVAVLRDRLDTTVKDDDTVTAAADAPVIGHIPADDELGGAHLVQPHSGSPAAEAVRQVRTNLSFLAVDHPPRAIMVTSALSSEGKTTTALNLAMTLAESGNTVTLVEADLRRPTLTRYLGLVGGAGLTNVLTRAAPLDSVIQEIDSAGQLHVLPSGPVPPNPSELLASDAMARVVETLLAERDIVVIDAPPVLPVADASALAGLVDGVVLCARWGSVSRDELGRASTLLRRVGGHVLGVVVTLVPAKAQPVAYGYGAPSLAVHRRPSRLDRIVGRRRSEAPTWAPLPTVRPRNAAKQAEARQAAGPVAADVDASRPGDLAQGARG
jgi:capsular exopolysaccharide synthesis family protein